MLHFPYFPVVIQNKSGTVRAEVKLRSFRLSFVPVEK